MYTLISVSDATLTACGNAQTGTATVKVNPLPTATISGNTEVCVSTASSIITFRGANGTAPYTFSYKVGAGDVQTIISNGVGVATVSRTNSVAGIYAYTLLSVNDASHTACSNPQGGIATIIVNPNTTIQLTSAAATTTQTVCINNAVRDITYQTTNSTSVTAIGLPAGVTGTYLNGVFTINGSPSLTGTFNYTVTAAGNCTTVQSTGRITVNPKPVGFNDEITSLSCGNTAISYNLQDNVNNTAKGGNAVPSNFSWTALTNSNVIGLSNGSGARITATLYNLSNVVQQVTYTVTPTSTLGTCPGAPFTVKVNVPVCSGISITKTADVSVVTQAGDPIKYTITVKNTATANQTRVKVTDPFLGGILAAPVSGDNGNGILEANESWIYTGIYRVTQSDIDNFGKPNAGTGKIINTATVSTAERPDVLSASATVNIVTTGEIALVKTGVLSSDFSTITYTFRITNTGKVRLSNLNLVDTKIRGAITVNPTVLEAGASVITTAVYTITDAEKRDGQVLNTATVTATSPSGSPVRDVSGTQSNNDDPTLHIIEDAPQALNDNAETKINQPVTVNLADNDLPSFNGLDKGSIVITRFPTNGQVQVKTDGTIVYTPNRGYSGPDDFRYTINDLKGKVSNVALVNITVTPIDLFIPNTFTPNGDGKNDTFKIIGRESFDSINLLIFNRWGNEVYRNMNYLDEWDGSGLSEATYYYIVVLKKGANEVTRKGWILLKR
ncbi:gliding motility-associated C-terminal domain-containing protein [Pedobacter westerhofensis]|uniref:DUF7507 domain-containing protein n=1 Tax=Pedobacter westerhofensis TaxID=425512 RepID=UPI0039EF141E